ncbi:SHSP domain-containing protein [Aphelenchoides bicaudatus]|nr:SHSP domain-containing protein [Aphelenchoides bicaudatus]
MSERRINVAPSNHSVLDNEFDSMRDRFEHEMRRVEEEMTRLRHEFEGYKPQNQRQSYTDSRGPSAADRYHHHEQRGPPSNGGALMSTKPYYDPYLDNLKSPLIKDESDGKTLRLRFDVAQYRPEEVTVKTVDNRLLVHAKHEEKGPSRTVFREYNQEFMLPQGTNAELISSTLSTDGVLTVEAPLPQLAIQNK